MAKARVRDLIVRLRWTGDADLDLSVEEPSGATASCQEPITRGGGVHRHDGYGPDPRNCYEEYYPARSECPAFTWCACGGSTGRWWEIVPS